MAKDYRRRRGPVPLPPTPTPPLAITPTPTPAPSPAAPGKKGLDDTSKALLAAFLLVFFLLPLVFSTCHRPDLVGFVQDFDSSMALPPDHHRVEGSYGSWVWIILWVLGSLGFGLAFVISLGNEMTNFFGSLAKALKGMKGGGLLGALGALGGISEIAEEAKKFLGKKKK